MHQAHSARTAPRCSPQIPSSTRRFTAAAARLARVRAAADGGDAAAAAASADAASPAPAPGVWDMIEYRDPSTGRLRLGVVADVSSASTSSSGSGGATSSTSSSGRGAGSSLVLLVEPLVRTEEGVWTVDDQGDDADADGGGDARKASGGRSGGSGRADPGAPRRVSLADVVRPSVEYDLQSVRKRRCDLSFFGFQGKERGGVCVPRIAAAQSY